MFMNSESKPDKYVHINQKMSAIELDLPKHLEKYKDELREKIINRFSFNMMDTSLEDRIQGYIERFLEEKEEIGTQ
jgi:hypothetical protein